jgi:hypothetical protein
MMIPRNMSAKLGQRWVIGGSFSNGADVEFRDRFP